MGILDKILLVSNLRKSYVSFDILSLIINILYRSRILEFFPKKLSKPPQLRRMAGEK
jgi:hypothetical protein